MFGRVLIKTVEVAICPAEFARDPHNLPICFLSILAMSVMTSILVKDALVRVITVDVDLVSDWDILSLSVGEVSEADLLALSES